MADLSLAEQFYLKEYEALRKEVDALFLEARALERYGLLAVGVVCAWLVQQSPYIEAHHAKWAWWIPVVFASLGWLRSWAIGRHFSLMGQYISTVETKILEKSEPKGWERSSESKRLMGRTATAFWCLLVAATILLAFFH